MQDSTDPLSGRPGNPGRTLTILGVVFVFSLLAFGYGLAVFLGILPAGWGPLATVQYALLVLGALLSSLIALIAVRRWRRGRPTTTRGEAGTLDEHRCDGDLARSGAPRRATPTW